MAKIVICEDSAYDTFQRYGDILGSHEILICCAQVGEFDRLNDGLNERGYPDQLEVRLGVPNVGTFRQIKPDLVFADGLGGRCKDVLTAAEAFFGTKDRAYLWTTSADLRDWARAQKYPIVEDLNHLVQIINGPSPSSITQH